MFPECDIVIALYGRFVPHRSRLVATQFEIVREVSLIPKVAFAFCVFVPLCATSAS